MTRTLSLIGVVLVAFLASALVFVGLGIALRTQDAVDPRDATVPFDGFLMTTAGIVMGVAACRIAAKLGVAKGVEGFIGVSFRSSEFPLF